MEALPWTEPCWDALEEATLVVVPEQSMGARTFLASSMVGHTTLLVAFDEDVDLSGVCRLSLLRFQVLWHEDLLMLSATRNSS